MREQKNCKNGNDYFIGLDIGTDSVGYAVVNTDYSLARFKGEPMWGVMLFDGAENCDGRRRFRTFRRRLARRQQRVDLIQRLFCREIAKVDPNFFLRLNESSLCKEERSPETLTGCDWDDKTYYEKYPTIHHLICEFMESAEGKDVRLLYLVCAWLVAHRGHFLNPADPDNVDALLDMNPLYEELKNWFDIYGDSCPWQNRGSAEKFSEILQKKQGIKTKKEELREKLFAGGKLPKKGEDDPFDCGKFLDLLAGGKVDVKDLFGLENPENSDKIALSDNDSVDEICSRLTEKDAELLRIAKNMYDCGSLTRILKGSQPNSGYPMISEVKVKQYRNHGKDLEKLKYLFRKYASAAEKKQVFGEKNGSYSVYIKKGKRKEEKQKKEKQKKGKQESFYDDVRKILDSWNLSEEDQKIRDEIFKRMDANAYMELQVHSDNGSIPYQLYYAELKKILGNAEKEFPFLSEKDADGKTVSEKILSVFTFRVPYYVGPLSNVDEDGKPESSHAWIRRKEPGDIFPWNFEEKVDLEECQKAFMDHLTGKCTYFPWESVLPKDSLLYSKYKILNEINSIKIEGRSISVEVKQAIFGLFKEKKKVKFEDIRKCLIDNEKLSPEDPAEKIGGIDKTIKSQYRPYHDFRRLLASKALTEEQVEDIIRHFVCMEDAWDRVKWLKKAYRNLSEEDVLYLSRLKYRGFGNLSEHLLNGFVGTSKETGGHGTVLHFLWTTNDNLMQILEDADRYDFKERLEEVREDYYAENHPTLTDRLEDLYLSNAVKRQVIRTLDVVSDILHARKGQPPKKIFVEMARGGTPEQKGKRTKSRPDQLHNLYREAKKNPDLSKDVKDMLQELGQCDGDASRKLQRKKLFLYFCQLGRCMYCGEPLSLAEIENGKVCDLDHIWPQSKIKDDSLDNLVLVHSKENREKSASYPLPEDCRTKMSEHWRALRKANLISEKKYSRLIRSQSFTAEEQMGFIARQLVETRQSTKAVAQLLKENCGEDTEIVYVKAGAVSEFRHEYGAICQKAFPLSDEDARKRELVKSRTANDVHHAHDAYLNVVVGNVFDERFSKQWFSVERDKYSLNFDALFGEKYQRDPGIWNPKTHLPNIDRTMATCAVHLTKYALRQKGAFFDIMPKAAAEKGKESALIPRKQGLDPKKYGGYNNPTVSFFVLAAYRSGRKKEVSLVPVRLLEAERFLASPEFAQEYVKKELGEKATDVTLPLGRRILKVNTVFSLDGFTVCLAGKNGETVYFRSLQTPYYSQEQIRYIKKVEKTGQKLADNKNYRIDERYDGISAEENLRLFDALAQKIRSDLFRKIPGSGLNMDDARRQDFENSEKEEQIKCLESMLEFLKTNRSGGCAMKKIKKTESEAKETESEAKGTESKGHIYLSKNLSNWKYSDVRILDRSAAGLFEKRSANLLDLLKEIPEDRKPAGDRPS